jgi:hydrogenase maturation protease
MTRTHRCSVIGLGSDHGDDAIGWAAIDALASCELPASTALHTCTTPATGLLPLLAVCDHAVIVDAVADGGPPGRVQRLSRAALAPESSRTGSHGTSVATVLALADALQLAPLSLTLIGVSIDPRQAQPGRSLSPPLAAAVPAVVAAVRVALDPATPAPAALDQAGVEALR